MSRVKGLGVKGFGGLGVLGFQGLKVLGFRIWSPVWGFSSKVCRGCRRMLYGISIDTRL